MDANEAIYRPELAAFYQGLERAGWSEGRNLQSAIRSGEGRPDIRITAYRLGAIIQFCSKDCKGAYYEAIHAKLAQGKRWLSFLSK
jgi:hypothetical protein